MQFVHGLGFVEPVALVRQGGKAQHRRQDRETGQDPVTASIGARPGARAGRASAAASVGAGDSMPARVYQPVPGRPLGALTRCGMTETKHPGQRYCHPLAHDRPLISGRPVRRGIPILAALAAAGPRRAAAARARRVAALPRAAPRPQGADLDVHPARSCRRTPRPILDELHTLGVDSVHLYMHWADIAPSPTSRRRPSFNAADPAAYPAAGWAVYDALVRGLAARGMTLYLDLVPPVPRWASGPGAPHPASQTEWRPSAPDFAQFVRAVGTRYSGHYVPAGRLTPPAPGQVLVDLE